MNPTPQRDFWNGNAVELQTLWTLTKRGQVARFRAADTPTRMGTADRFMKSSADAGGPKR